MQQRIYSILNKASNRHLMVRASNQAQALRYVARGNFEIEVASAIDVADFMEGGRQIQDARDEPEDSETDTTTEKE